MTNGDRFIAAYNSIHAFLRQQSGKDRFLPFPEALRLATAKNATVAAYAKELLPYVNLRNAIVHDLGNAPEPIADPRDAIVTRIEFIWSRLSQPRTLRSLEPLFPLQIFGVDDLFSEVLRYMRQKAFSQIIALNAARHAILSTEGIAHWLEERAGAQNIALEDTRLEEVLGCEPSGTCRYLKADDTVEQARQLFSSDLDERVFSALVTETGSDKEKPINIVTPWDIVHGRLL